MKNQEFELEMTLKLMFNLAIAQQERKDWANQQQRNQLFH
jgi:hypothetical protein